ncbi:hypothetical protein [Butyrivibrio sp. AE2032]|uniref:hypothetical protein n=1 Tax=Butyrivibrio sp. AE2032 TaxID=1458463 RepID=UPI000557C1C8|nr:hypothetical protein [Butyrivibrio sp. AE2032]
MRFKKIMASALTAGMMLSFIPAATAMADTTGWKGEGEYWRYFISETEYYRNTWEEIDGHWYYFMDDGSIVINCWALIDGKAYHFDTKGHMEKNKWVQRGKLHLGYDSDGYWLDDETKPGWGYVGPNGVAYTGWKQINGSWYFFGNVNNDNEYGQYCAMYAGMREIGDTYYYFGTNGKMQTNCWFEDDAGTYYYFGPDGKIVDGWQKINGKWYYFNPYNYPGYSMSTGATLDWYSPDDWSAWDVWIFESNGALTSKTGWYYDSKTESWYYIKGGGKCRRNEWYKEGGKWYYFEEEGRMVANKKNFIINEKAYDFDSNGVCRNPDSGRTVKGWLKTWLYWLDGEAWVYGGSDGKLYRDQWLTSGNTKYYFDEEGVMACDFATYTLGDKVYSFDASGKSTDLTGNKKGWVPVDDTYVYVGSDGKLYSGWQKINGKWYYFDEYDCLAMCDTYLCNYDGDYIFDKDCALQTGWSFCNNDWHYSDSNGRVVKDKWIKTNGSWYYLNEYGDMVTGEYIVHGLRYQFSDDGKCLNPDTPERVILLCR